jgi:hypothetical protein
MGRTSELGDEVMRLRSVMDQTGGEIFNVQDVSHLHAVFAAQGLCGAVQERILRALKKARFPVFVTARAASVRIPITIMTGIAIFAF